MGCGAAIAIRAVNDMTRAPRRKPRAEMMVADGIGGMRKIEDHRFGQGGWPISFEIPLEQEQAEQWSRYLCWRCRSRGWQLASLGQLDRSENSGTISISDDGTRQLDVVWERKRNRPLKVK